ncbi:MAG: FGGY-family carbohydrate kinase [Proteobacteria bacterium]|jgi:FGGY-family pentulose kinase|nr:FGGY-family carbohydrate kinase [Pseudomonadota bacterium]
MSCYLGIDVGTGSARAGVFSVEGRQLGLGVHPIQMWRPQEDFVEQSSDDIWHACGVAIRQALSEAGVAKEDVAGIGFDATCSLVALDAADQPVTVSPTGADAQNVIVWMDHRSMAQTQRINSTTHDVLQYVGGAISPEMEVPKLLWLKENLPRTWERTARFFDLPDYLSYRATNVDTRSLCTTVCKWTYLGHQDSASGSMGRWDEGFFRQVGLGDLVDEGFARIGTTVRPMGERIGGLTEKSANEMGLAPNTPVGVSIIDAHAGGLGLLGIPLDGNTTTIEQMEERLALIGGTSSCQMAVSRQAKYIPGIWGPYYSAMVPGFWLTEGGQSATGALIDHVVHNHGRSAELLASAKSAGTTVYELLNARLEAMAGEVPFPAALTKNLHVLPYFHGNRSPRADPTLRGMASGFRLTDSLDSLALLYLATIQAIAHGTRHIIDTMNNHGYRIEVVIGCGGDLKNPVFVREHADITGCRLVLPREREAVLLGAATIGAVASGNQPSLLEAMASMNTADKVILPGAEDVRDYHERKHGVFHQMYTDQLRYRELMAPR